MAAAVLAACLLFAGAALADLTPGEGAPWPNIAMSKPEPAAEARYLGLRPDKTPFKLDEVKGGLVLVEVFSMYCPICQVEAERVNQLFDLIKQRGLADKLKIMGLGAGNSEMEVEVFRSKYKTPFALVADGGFAAHKALGEPRTPFFLLVRLQPGGAKILYAKLGQFGEPTRFLDTLLDKAGLK